MCDARCWNAGGPTCRCDCGGVNHGNRGFGGYRSRKWSRKPFHRIPRQTWSQRQPQLPQQPQPATRSQGGILGAARSFLLGVGKNALVAALLVGLTAVHPVLGATATKAYAVYSHGIAGFALYNTYVKWKSGGESAPRAAGEAAKVITGEAAVGASNMLASSMVNGLKQTGMIDQISKETNTNPVITSDMLRGTISTSASQGFGDLAGYTVEKEVET